jgi:HD-like signal output (HDOD) protein
VLAQECPEDLVKAVDLAVAREIPLYVAETEILGASHAEIGAYLLGIWGLPYSVVEAVAHHHRPDRVTHAEFDVLAAIVIGHSLASTDDAAAFRRRVPADAKVDHHYLSAVGAPFDWDEATRRVSETTDLEEIIE